MASTKITRTSSASTEKKLTISTWIKRSYAGEESIIGNTNSGSNWAMFYFNGANKLQFAAYIGGSYAMRYTTNREFSDTNAWYHLVATVDVSLSSPEVKIYVNGEEQTSLEYNTTPSQNQDIGWFNAWSFEIGVQFGSSYYLNGCLSDLYYIQGYIYPASTFGEIDSTSGIWKPITNPTINFGGNGGNSCHLKFENSANMDLDSGSNNLSFTTSGTLTQTEDTPSNNFATLNARDRSRANTNNYGDYLFNGSNTFDTTSSNGMKAVARSTMGVQTGKWYWEAKIITNDRLQIGITKESIMGKTDPYYDLTEYIAVSMNKNGTITGRYTGSAADEYATGTSNTANDILGFALDMDNQELYIHKNGTYVSNGSAVGVPTSGSSRTGGLIDALTGTRDDYLPSGEYIFPFVNDPSTSGGVKVEYNFGGGKFGTTALASSNSDSAGLGLFEYSVPSGYYSLCTKNIKNYG